MQGFDAGPPNCEEKGRAVRTGSLPLTKCAKEKGGHACMAARIENANPVS